MRSCLALLVPLFCWGCAAAKPMLHEMPSASVSTADEVRWWANSADPRHYTLEVMLELLTSIEHSDLCPASSSSLGHTTWKGGCVDSEGNSWTGGASVRRSATEVSARFDNFGSFEPDRGCDLDAGSIWHGHVRIQTVADGTKFEVDLVMREVDLDEACHQTTEILAIDYRGRTSAVLLSDEADDDVVVWSGEGRVGDLEHGKLELRTVDQRIDRNVCKTESLSGWTELRSGDHLVLIRYDGEHDCDETKTVTWELDGQPMGELEGVGLGCRVGVEGPYELTLLGLVILGIPSRRRRGASHLGSSKTSP